FPGRPERAELPRQGLDRGEARVAQGGLGVLLRDLGLGDPLLALPLIEEREGCRESERARIAEIISRENRCVSGTASGARVARGEGGDVIGPSATLRGPRGVQPRFGLPQGRTVLR